ncbi:MULTISPECIES: serine/threonine-protein kinase [unclassified Nocardia]|uniref:serine/threonine-protein kinase n=1 Tax=unclassified Nocardia TaxID=2637762 RepID=UPI001CE4544C|nr:MULTISPECIES: serine/threonine-protein kinase [unclassified Nocardia]
MTDRHPLAVGSQFGPYRLDRLIGRGGMGEVFEAYDTVKDRTVALKVLPDRLADDPVYRERFRREAHAAARLSEPHVIPIHDYGEIDGRLYLDMRLVDGTSLRTLLREGPLTPTRAVALIAQVASALDAAHADGLVHRDIKPDNILVTPEDFAYLADFGIAHATGRTALTKSGSAIGSYHYMAPERFAPGAVTAAVDVYALACVLYECLTGTKAYPAESEAQLVRAHMFDPAPRPSHLLATGSPDFDAVITRGLAKLPRHRYRTAGALAAAARAALAETSSAQTEAEVPADISSHSAETVESDSAPAEFGGALFDDHLLERLLAAHPKNEPSTGATDSDPPVGPAESGGPPGTRLGLLALLAALILAVATDLGVWLVNDRPVTGSATADGSALRGPDIDLLLAIGPIGYKRTNCSHIPPDSAATSIFLCAANPRAGMPEAQFRRFRGLDQLRAYYQQFRELFHTTNCPDDPPGPDGPSIADGQTVGRKACYGIRTSDPAAPRPAMIVTNESALAVAEYRWDGPGGLVHRDYIAANNGWQFVPTDNVPDPDRFSAADHALFARLTPDFTAMNCLHADPPANLVNALVVCATPADFPDSNFYGFADQRSANQVYQNDRTNFGGHTCAGAADDGWRRGAGHFFCYPDDDPRIGARTCLFAFDDRHLFAARFCTALAKDPGTAPKTEAELSGWFRQHFS